MTCSLPDQCDALIIEGGIPLVGCVKISGSKNAALPIMAASILSSVGTTQLENLPLVSDVLTLKRVMEKLGVSVRLFEDSAIIDASGIVSHIVPLNDSMKMRASVLMAGPLLARTGEAVIVQPGGCVIGSRPIDMHLMGFQKLGAKIKHLNNKYVEIKANRLHGTAIDLPFPSMGATENLMMAACLAEGETVIRNAAREPEIVDLANFLASMGAKIVGAGASSIKIDGVKKLGCTNYKVMPDRIEAGTYIIAAAITQSEVQIENVMVEHLAKVIEILTKIGISIRVQSDKNIIVVEGLGKYAAANIITAPYPGIPTDLQPLLTSLLSLSCGISTVKETVFPERFCYIKELTKMGADVSVVSNKASVRGVSRLFGADVSATDLRAGAALILAGLAAEGVTTIMNCSLVYRGYERIEEKLQRLGASVTTI